MAHEQLVQSGDADSVPYITVEQDARGGTCWVVVVGSAVERCYSGHDANAAMERMCATALDQRRESIAAGGADGT